MIFADSQYPFDDAHWRRINMRKVSHLVGAEMLHNLYNRHWPRINSLRFRHTITNYKAGIVEAYAPIAEWTYLQHWLSKKFLQTDPILIREIEAIMDPPYDLIDEIMAKIDGQDLTKVNNEDLALLLIDILDYPIGDIYKLNVVQIEYSLNFALHKILEAYEPNTEDRNELLATLIAPGELTASQEEEVAFGTIVTVGSDKNVTDPKDSADVMELITKHYATYAGSHCAYGEEPPTLQDYINKYIFLISRDHKPPTREEAETNVRELRKASDRILAKLNDDRLTTLCELMAKIGVFRDKNKAKLGDTVLRRLKVLDEIARRTEVPREDINYYLTAELTGLLDTGKRVSSEVINDRRANGVRFTRSEDTAIGITPIATLNSVADASNLVKGICASIGEVEGVAKIVSTKDDITKVDPGDIMVAIGTDFDLLEIMNIAGGIITEEGGLLSHASVVSRELKKPCLIGVHNATRHFKDGDRLVLDATAGQIKILTK